MRLDVTRGEQCAQYLCKWRSHRVSAEFQVQAHGEVESELAPLSADQVHPVWEGLHVGHGGRQALLFLIWFACADDERVQQLHRRVVVRQLCCAKGLQQYHHRRRPAQLLAMEVPTLTHLRMARFSWPGNQCKSSSRRHHTQRSTMDGPSLAPPTCHYMTRMNICR